MHPPDIAGLIRAGTVVMRHDQNRVSACDVLPSLLREAAFLIGREMMGTLR
jgi:vacuolar-type H+-ATPase subunit B/Vma2